MPSKVVDSAGNTLRQAIQHYENGMQGPPQLLPQLIQNDDSYKGFKYPGGTKVFTVEDKGGKVNSAFVQTTDDGRGRAIRADGAISTTPLPYNIQNNLSQKGIFPTQQWSKRFETEPTKRQQIENPARPINKLQRGPAPKPVDSWAQNGVIPRTSSMMKV